MRDTCVHDDQVIAQMPQIKNFLRNTADEFASVQRFVRGDTQPRDKGDRHVEPSDIDDGSGLNCFHLDSSPSENGTPENTTFAERR